MTLRSALLLALLLAACGGGGSVSPNPPPPPPPPPAPGPVTGTVEVSPDSSKVLIGSTGQLTATAKTASGTVLTGKAFTWASTTPAVASVSSTGLVTPVAPGRGVITASVDGVTGTAIVTVAAVVTVLPGVGSSPARTALPELRYEPNPAAFDTGRPGFEGIAVSPSVLMVTLTPTATIAEVNDLLNALQAEVIGGNKPASAIGGGALVLRLPTATHAGMDAALTLARAHAGVALALFDIAAKQEDVPAPGGPASPFNWRWPASSTSGGNWGWDAARIPALWSFNDAIRKGAAGTQTVLVLDGQFVASHQDVGFRDILNTAAMGGAPQAKAAWHGTSVAGVIGAKFGNGLDVDGVNPFARMVAFGRLTTSMIGWFTDMRAALALHPEIRVVNISEGLDAALMQSDPAHRFVVDQAGDAYKSMMADLAVSGQPLPVVVVAAGNENGADAQYESPMSNAAIRLGLANVIVVEASGPGNPPVHPGFSNVGGEISAPGAGIMVLNNSPTFKIASGTSFASPFVAGIVSYMYELLPNLPAPTLTSNPAKDALLHTLMPITNQTGFVDAFAAVLDLDRVLGGDAVLRKLLDVDDGTIDGNLRVDYLGAEFLGTDKDGDGGVGDGKINMADFRRWRDALLQIESPAGLSLDGRANHPKRDLNGDGVPDPSSLEEYGARVDFNGDTHLSRSAKRVMGGALGSAPMTDLEVLQSRFNDPNYAVADLPNLISSGDIAVGLRDCASFNLASNIRIEVRVSGTTTPVVQTRTVGNTGVTEVLTLPDNPAGYNVRVEAFKADGVTIVASDQEDLPVAPGSDTFWDAVCKDVQVDAPTLPNLTIATSGSATIRVKYSDLTGVIAPVQNARLELTLPGGHVTPAQAPLTDANGMSTVTLFRDGASVTTLTVLATLPDGPFRQATFQLATVPPVQITTTSLPAGAVGNSYQATLGATGGTGQYLWTTPNGSPPPGLILFGNGVLSGTPTTAGLFTFDAQAKSGPNTDLKTFSVDIAADPWLGVFAGTQNINRPNDNSGPITGAITKQVISGVTFYFLRFKEIGQGSSSWVCTLTITGLSATITSPFCSGGGLNGLPVLGSAITPSSVSAQFGPGGVQGASFSISMSRVP